jgi:hypothetical protein
LLENQSFFAEMLAGRFVDEHAGRKDFDGNLAGEVARAGASSGGRRCSDRDARGGLMTNDPNGSEFVVMPTQGSSSGTASKVNAL